MPYTRTMRTLILSFAGCAFTAAALAQWQWIDKDGHKVFSDRAPPADISQKNITKQPGSKAASPAASAASREGALPPAIRTSAPMQSSGAPKLAGRDVELETRKKQAADLEKAQKQAEAEKIAIVKADSCDRAKKGHASLLSGVRILVTNAKGEREFMDDNARLTETRRLQTIADSDCLK